MVLGVLLLFVRWIRSYEHLIAIPNSSHDVESAFEKGCSIFLHLKLLYEVLYCCLKANEIWELI
jgi:hypothetical protein